MLSEIIGIILFVVFVFLIIFVPITILIVELPSILCNVRESKQILREMKEDNGAVQVAYFKNEANANAYARKMIENGYTVYVKEVIK